MSLKRCLNWVQQMVCCMTTSQRPAWTFCPSGFHVPDDTEWDSFLSEGGTIQLQGDEVSFICNGDGASSDGGTIFWVQVKWVPMCTGSTISSVLQNWVAVLSIVRR